MSKIRSSNTKPEILLKKSLKGLRMRYQPKMYGKPDFASKKRKVAVFVDGCFWHKCPVCYREPQSNTNYWIPKLERNASRDKEVGNKLKKTGWKVYRVWEHQVYQNSEAIKEKISELL